VLQVCHIMHAWIARPRTDETGASLVEYSLLVAAIALVCLLAVEAFGGGVSTMYDDSGTSIANATP
jgi:Flp pilus assembly pilin Flp